MTWTLPAIAGLHQGQADTGLAGTGLASPVFSPRIWVLPVVALFGMAMVKLSGLDHSLFLIQNALAAALPDAVWAWLTALGNGLLVYTILLALIVRRPDAATAAFIAVVIVTLAVQLLKHLFDLPRPASVLPPETFQVIGPRLHAHAFPSGHTATIFALAALFAGHTLRISLFGAALLAASLIGFSRIAVGAHWPTDVLAGAAIGWLAGFAGLYLAARCPKRLEKILYVFAVGFAALTACALLTFLDSGYSDARWFERGVALVSLGLSVFFVLQKFEQPYRGKV